MKRHVRITGGKVRDQTLSAADIGAGAVGASELAAKAVKTSKIGSALTQVGTIQTGTYWTYPVAYSSVKGGVVSKAGTSYGPDVFLPSSNILAGSAKPLGGSPSGDINIMVVGDV